MIASAVRSIVEQPDERSAHEQFGLVESLEWIGAADLATVGLREAEVGPKVGFGVDQQPHDGRQTRLEGVDDLPTELPCSALSAVILAEQGRRRAGRPALFRPETVGAIRCRHRRKGGPVCGVNGELDNQTRGDAVTPVVGT
jgi:hypothetical protein